MLSPYATQKHRKSLKNKALRALYTKKAGVSASLAIAVCHFGNQIARDISVGDGNP